MTSFLARVGFLCDHWNRMERIMLTIASNKTVHRGLKPPLGLPFFIYVEQNLL